MIIQHNIMALNAHRQLGGNNTLVSKNLEKLSSGFKINRAGDDAAGLAISEKMRAQITGLSRAQANAQDGISLVQTAEGALTEVHSMLNRMVDLATQSANGTIKDFDRSKIQDEMDALSGEIDRISKATDFNGIKLLDGSLGGAAVKQTDGTAGTATVTPATAAVYTKTASKLTADGDMTIAGHKVAIDFTGGVVDLDDQLAAFATSWNAAGAGKGDDWTAAVNAAGTDVTFTAKKGGVVGGTEGPADPPGTLVAGDQTIAGVNSQTVAGTPTAASTELDFDGKSGAQLFGGTMEIGDKIFEFVKTGEKATGTNIKIELGANDDAAAIATKVIAAVGTNATGLTAAVVAGETTKVAINETTAVGTTKAPTVKFDKVGLVMQVGDTADAYNKVTVSVGDMSTKGLAIEGLKVDSQQAATESMAKIKDAINSVSTNRSALGALQNRLEHTINNLSVTTENMTAAESRIRDVDMAKEMMHFTKNNVLSQAAQAMLAQANQQPQQVLQLLR